MNQKLIEKYCEFERAIAQEKGKLTLLVLLEPEESLDGWDFVLSADWLPEYTGETLAFVIDKLKNILGLKEYYQISKIIFLRPDEPFIQTFQAFLEDNPQRREFSGIEILGLAIKRAYVIVPWIETPEDQLQKLIRYVGYVALDLQRLRNEYEVLAKGQKQLEWIMRIALQNSKLLKMPSNLELPPPSKNLLSTGDDIKDN